MGQSLTSQNLPVNVVLTIRDKRFTNQYAIPYSSIQSQVISDLKSRNYKIVEQGATGDLKNVLLFEMTIDYLNFYESESNNLFGKGMITIIVRSPDNIYKESSNITVANPYLNLRLRNLDNEKFTEAFAKTEEDIQRQLSTKIIDKVSTLLEQGALQLMAKSQGENEKNTSAKNLPSSFPVQLSSDIDNDIPLNTFSNTSRFALIFGNEDYNSYQSDLSSEVNVEFASHDARIFREYALRTLGIPEKNVIFLVNGTLGQMNQAISKMNLIIKNTSGEAEVFVYYAGHGMPDEITKEAYIMPVDVSAKNLTSAIKLKDFYAKLFEHPSKRLTVFIDACFSGGARNQGMLEARSVRMKPSDDHISGKMVVFTASSGEQSSLPYKDKNHGMFTYFLLKKLKETKGQVTYKELADYIKQNVGIESVVINSKEQTPQTIISNEVSDSWEAWKLNDK